jgi:hypothetical protein
MGNLRGHWILRWALIVICVSTGAMTDETSGLSRHCFQDNQRPRTRGFASAYR